MQKATSRGRSARVAIREPEPKSCEWMPWEPLEGRVVETATPALSFGNEFFNPSNVCKLHVAVEFLVWYWQQAAGVAINPQLWLDTFKGPTPNGFRSGAGI